jgi:hypothetical protein
MQAVERADRWFLQAIAMLLMLLGFVLLLWAAFLVLIQAIAWLKAGQWQPVPLSAALLAPEARFYEFQVVAPIGRYGEWHPLKLVPDIASAASVTEVTRAIAGNALGLQRIIAWLIDIGLAGWMVATALVSLALAVLCGERSRDFVVSR